MWTKAEQAVPQHIEASSTYRKDTHREIVNVYRFVYVCVRLNPLPFLSLLLYRFPFYTRLNTMNRLKNVCMSHTLTLFGSAAPIAYVTQLIYRPKTLSDIVRRCVWSRFPVTETQKPSVGLCFEEGTRHGWWDKIVWGARYKVRDDGNLHQG